MGRTKLISVIIPCRNGRKHIKKCVDSLLKSNYADFEVIVIDDASTDETEKILKIYEKEERVRVFRFNKNRGPCVARNFGVEKSRGAYIAFFDADTLIDKKCLSEFVRRFGKEKNLGAIQARIMSGNTNLLDCAGHFLSPFGFPYETGVSEKASLHTTEMPIFGAKSAGMAIRKNVFKKVGGFDNDYFIYGEETDLCWRVWMAGYKIIYLPTAIVRHFEKSTLNAQTKHKVFYEGAKNNTRNILKNAQTGLLIRILPLHILGWVGIGIFLLIRKGRLEIFWILKGLMWNVTHIKSTAVKRKHSQSLRKSGGGEMEIIFGSYKNGTLLKKGLKWIKNV